MAPFFSYEYATFTKEIDFTGSYQPTASIYAQFVCVADKIQFMLKYSDKINELR